ncbi:MAG: hypothetical protein RLY43_916, partial [Bacteroidota bacterium]
MGSYHKRIKNGLIAIVGLFVAFKIAFAMVLITDRNISNAEYILLGGLSLIMDVILVYRFIKRYRSPYKWVLDKVNAATFIRPTSYATSSAASYYTITYFNIFGKPLSVSKAVTIDSLMMDFQHYLYREMKKY